MLCYSLTYIGILYYYYINIIVCACVCPQRLEEVLRSLELELQVVLTHVTQVIRTDLGSPGRAGSILNHLSSLHFNILINISYKIFIWSHCS